MQRMKYRRLQAATIRLQTGIRRQQAVKKFARVCAATITLQVLDAHCKCIEAFES